MKKRTLVITCFLMLVQFSFAQMYQQWAAIYNGPAGGIDWGRSMRVDASGNSYVAGWVSGTGTGKDCAVVKYDSLGVQQWAALYNSPDSLDDLGYAVVIDSQENVYLTGESASSATGVDFITIKYNSAGVEQWAMRYDGTASGADVGVDIALDQAGNVFVIGTSAGIASADDYLTIKYNNAGVEQWVARYDGIGNDVDDARTIGMDDEGNVYISGGSMGDTTDYDFITIKYNTLGVPQWTARYNGPGNGYDLVFYQGSIIIDSLMNVYICGYSDGADSIYEYAVVKYDSSGNELWASRYAGDRMGKDDFADAITLDDSLNVYVTGALYDSINDYDIVTIKYNSAGVFQWEAAYNGLDSSWDEGYGVLIDDTGNVYVGGRSNHQNFSGADYVIIKYDSQGNELWDVRYIRGGFSWPYKIAMDADGNVFIGGWSSTGSPATADFTIVKYGWNPVGIQAQGNSNPFNSRNYPNPFSGKTTIEYRLAEAGKATISIYNLLGKKVCTLLDEMQAQGKHSLVWDGKDNNSKKVAGGVYFYTIESGSGVIGNGKMVFAGL